MISLKTLADKIEKGINSIAPQGITYVVHADMGKYKRAIRKKGRVTNAVLTIRGSSIIPTQTVLVATESAMLEVCVQLPYENEDESVITAHRQLLDTYFASTKVDVIKDEDGGKTYTVSTTYALATSGTVEQRPAAGTSYTFRVEIEYAFIQDGLNSNDCKFKIDGIDLPFQTATITRRATTEANPYSNTDGEAKNVTTASVMSFDFQIPALTTSTELSKLLLPALLSGDNTAHTLTVTFENGEPKDYNVIFGQSSLIAQGVDNAGQTVSLIETYDLTETPDTEAKNGL